MPCVNSITSYNIRFYYNFNLELMLLAKYVYVNTFSSSVLAFLSDNFTNKF